MGWFARDCLSTSEYRTTSSERRRCLPRGSAQLPTISPLPYFRVCLAIQREKHAAQRKQQRKRSGSRSRSSLSFSKKSEQRSRHDSSNESHDHEHGEDALRENAHVIADI